MTDKTKIDKDYIKVRGLSLNGAYALGVVGYDGIQINSLPTPIIILSFFIFGFLFALLSIPLGYIGAPMIIMLIFPIIGGIVGFVAATHCLSGKKRMSFDFADISSIITRQGEITVCTNDNKLHIIRATGQKQLQFLTAVADQIEKNEDYKISVHGDKYSIEKKTETI